MDRSIQVQHELVYMTYATLGNTSIHLALIDVGLLTGATTTHTQHRTPCRR